MALATQCPHCHTKFRVAADQLKLRGGIVRCGACQAIFDGGAHLIDLAAQARMDAEEKAAASAASATTSAWAPSPVAAPAVTAAPVAAPFVVPSPAPVAESVPAGEPASEDEAPVQAPVQAPDTGRGFDPDDALPQPVEADVVDDLAVQIDALPPPADERIEPRLALPEAVASEAAVREAHAEAQPAPIAPDFTPRAVDAPPAAAYVPAGRIEPSFGPAAEAPVDETMPADESAQVEEPVQIEEPAQADEPVQVEEPVQADEVQADEPQAAEPLRDATPDFAAYVEPEPEPAHVDAPAHEPAPDFAAYVEPDAGTDVAPDVEQDAGTGARSNDEPDGDSPDEPPRDATPWPELDIEPYPDPAPAAEPEPEPEAAPAPESPSSPDSTPEPLAAPSPAVADDDVMPSPALPLRASAGDDDSEALAAAAATAAAAAAPTKSARSKAADARARRSKLTPTPIDETPKLRVPETDEPEFVKLSRRKERATRTRRIAMGLGSAVLLLVLAGQGIVEFRNVLAARFPATGPLLSALCAPFGCRIGLPAQVDSLVIETGELSSLGPDTYSLNTLLRNQGSLVQTWPSIELELVDDNNKALLRRVFGPADYLPSASVAAGFAARSEQPVRLDFVLAGVKPAGYHLFVFYP